MTGRRRSGSMIEPLELRRLLSAVGGAYVPPGDPRISLDLSPGWKFLLGNPTGAECRIQRFELDDRQPAAQLEYARWPGRRKQLLPRCRVVSADAQRAVHFHRQIDHAAIRRQQPRHRRLCRRHIPYRASRRVWRVECRCHEFSQRRPVASDRGEGGQLGEPVVDRRAAIRRFQHQRRDLSQGHAPWDGPRAFDDIGLWLQWRLFLRAERFYGFREHPGSLGADQCQRCCARS